MAVQVEIDRDSGFCGGVIRAIGKAEQFLDEAAPKTRLYSLGAIVHNEAELDRLGAKGLVSIGLDALDAEVDGGAVGKTLLIRAHGEPPATYRKAAAKGFEVIDCTCPVVLQLQHRIREAHQRLHAAGRTPGQLLIFGKIGHAEVLGLLGQVSGDALVVENKQMLLDAIREGRFDLTRPVEIFSQTTASPSEYADVCSAVEVRMAREFGMEIYRFRGTGRVTIHHTICSQVATRHAKLTEFSLSHDVILFVSGKSSSNGRVLSDLCKSVNIRTYLISGPDPIRTEWFHPDDRVGICGATSTPKWLLEQVACRVKELSGAIDSRHALLRDTVGNVNLHI